MSAVGAPQLISFALSFYNDFFRLSSVGPDTLLRRGARAAQQGWSKAGAHHPKRHSSAVCGRAALQRRVEDTSDRALASPSSPNSPPPPQASGKAYYLASNSA